MSAPSIGGVQVPRGNGDTVRLPFAGVPIATIDPADVAEVAAAALTTNRHEGRSYRLSGPDSLLPAEQVAIVAAATGRDLRFEAQPDDEARAEMTAAMPVEYVDAFFSFFADGTVDESTVLPTVQDILGRPPRRFEEMHAGGGHTRVVAVEVVGLQ